MKRSLVVWLSVHVMLVAPAVADEPAQKPDTRPDVAADIALLEGVIKAKARDKDSAEEVAKAHVRIVQLHTAKGDVRAAQTVREHLVEWFDAQGHSRDGGPLATVAAEARYQFLLPTIEKELTRKLVIEGKLVPDCRKVFDNWHEVVIGPLKLAGVAGKDAKLPKGKPLVDQVLAVRDYAAPHWSRAASLQGGRLAMALSREVSAVAALEPPDLQPVWVEMSKRYRDIAGEIWERSWKQADAAGQREGFANDIRKELAAIKPAEYPALDREQLETSTPQQKEASRLASLAQQTDNLQLRVLYLRKATTLDPSNPALKELLRVAEAELEAQARVPR